MRSLRCLVIVGLVAAIASEPARAAPPDLSAVQFEKADSAALAPAHVGPALDSLVLANAAFEISRISITRETSPPRAEIPAMTSTFVERTAVTVSSPARPPNSTIPRARSG
jgi:hypothetical protein